MFQNIQWWQGFPLRLSRSEIEGRLPISPRNGDMGEAMSNFLNAINKYRRAHWLYVHHLKPLAKLYEMWIYLIHNSFISSECEIGKGTILGYKGIGVVIHKRAVIGENCIIGQNVTIGGQSGHYQVPIIGNGCYIASGAKVIGPVTLGDNVVIGANAVMTKSAPSNTVWAGVPAHLLRSTRHDEMRYFSKDKCNSE